MKISAFTSIVVLVCLFFLSIGYVRAFTESFSLEGYRSLTRSVNLSAGDEVYVKLTVVGTQQNVINLTVLNPENKVVLKELNMASEDFKLKVSEAGEYRFLFENLNSAEDKHITFHCSVQHYILGYPQEIVLLFATILIVLGAIVVFIAMSPKP